MLHNVFALLLRPRRPRNSTCPGPPEAPVDMSGTPSPRPRASPKADGRPVAQSARPG